MSADNTYTPYFYIIRHKDSGKTYAGSRWKKECNSIELLKYNGYTTSSKVVNQIISDQGIEAFEIVEVKELDQIKLLGFNTVLEYETQFLKENNCKYSEDWLNQHDNSSSKNFHYPNGSNAMHNKEIASKAVSSRISTMIEKYGVSNHTQIPEMKRKQQSKTEETVKQKYCVDNVFQLQEVKEKIKQTIMETYGVSNINQTKENRERISANNNKITFCEFCGVHIKYSSYITSHGKYCDKNPNSMFVSDIISKKTYKKKAACSLKIFRELKHLFW
jgi:hypothetical protein